MRINSNMGFDPYKDHLDKKAEDRAKDRKITLQRFKKGQQTLAENPELRVFAGVKGHDARRRKNGEMPKITLPKLKFMEGDE